MNLYTGQTAGEVRHIDPKHALGFRVIDWNSIDSDIDSGLVASANANAGIADSCTRIAGGHERRGPADQERQILTQIEFAQLLLVDVLKGSRCIWRKPGRLYYNLISQKWQWNQSDRNSGRWTRNFYGVEVCFVSEIPNHQRIQTVDQSWKLEPAGIIGESSIGATRTVFNNDVGTGKHLPILARYHAIELRLGIRYAWHEHRCQRSVHC